MGMPVGKSEVKRLILVQALPGGQFLQAERGNEAIFAGEGNGRNQAANETKRRTQNQ